MAKILDLIYRVKDQASAPLGKIKTAQQGLHLSMKDGLNIATAAVGAFTSVGAVVGKLIGDYQAFTIAAGDMAHALGITTEEASSMMEMADDLGVDVGTLQASFKAMARSGIDPSIKGLITVREKLDATKTPAERLALAQKLLGKNSAELIPIFDQLTNEELAEYIDTMGEAKVVTEAEYQQALKNREAIDKWTDAIDGIKLSVGGFLTNGLMPYLEIAGQLPEVIRKVIDPMDDLAESAGNGEKNIRNINRELAALDGGVTHHTIVTTHIDRTGEPDKPFTTGVDTGPHPTYINADGYYMVWDGTKYTPRGKAPGRQMGGPVGGGQSYLVGEKGPEIFTPKQSGEISPNIDQLARSIDRLVMTLPVILRDAVEKAK